MPSHLINRMRQLNYPVNLDGMCFGSACTAIRTFLSSDKEVFFRTMELLNDNNKKALVEIIKDPKSASCIDIKAILDELSIFMGPRALHKDAVKALNISGSQIKNMFHVFEFFGYKEADIRKASMMCLFTKQDLVRVINQLIKDNHGKLFSMFIAYRNHVVFLGWDGEQLSSLNNTCYKRTDDIKKNIQVINNLGMDDYKVKGEIFGEKENKIPAGIYIFSNSENELKCDAIKQIEFTVSNNVNKTQILLQRSLRYNLPANIKECINIISTAKDLSSEKAKEYLEVALHYKYVKTITELIIELLSSNLDDTKYIKILAVEYFNSLFAENNITELLTFSDEIIKSGLSDDIKSELLRVNVIDSVNGKVELWSVFFGGRTEAVLAYKNAIEKSDLPDNIKSNLLETDDLKIRKSMEILMLEALKLQEAFINSNITDVLKCFKTIIALKLPDNIPAAFSTANLLHLQNNQRMSGLWVAIMNGEIKTVSACIDMTAKSKLNNNVKAEILSVHDLLESPTLLHACAEGKTENILAYINTIATSELHYDVQVTLLSQIKFTQNLLMKMFASGYMEAELGYINLIKKSQLHDDVKFKVLAGEYNETTSIVELMLKAEKLQRAFYNNNAEDVVEYAGAIINSIYDSALQKKLLYLKNSQGISGFNMAVMNGNEEAVTAYIKVFEASNFTKNDIIELLEAQNNLGEFVLYTALHEDVKAAEIYINAIIKSKISDDVKLRLLSVKNTKETLVLSSACLQNAIKILETYINIIANLDLDDVMKLKLLESKDESGDSALSLAYQYGDTSTFEKYINVVIKSTLPNDMKVELLKGINASGNVVLYQAYLEGNAEIIKLYADAIVNSDLDDCTKLEVLSVSDAYKTAILYQALMTSNTEIIKLYVDVAASLNLADWMKLELLEAKPSVLEEIPVLWYACMNHKKEAVEEYINAIAKTNLHDDIKLELCAILYQLCAVNDIHIADSYINALVNSEFHDDIKEKLLKFDNSWKTKLFWDEVLDMGGNHTGAILIYTTAVTESASLSDATKSEFLGEIFKDMQPDSEFAQELSDVIMNSDLPVIIKHKINFNLDG